MKNIFRCSALLLFICSMMLSSCSGGSKSGSSGDDAAGSQRIFYVDSESGSDSNDGLSENSAWFSIDKVNSSDFIPGDSVKFKRGETFSGSLVLSSSGSEQTPIIFDAYGNGDLPVLSGAVILNEWTDEGSGIYSITISCIPGETGAGIVLQDGTPLNFRSWDSDYTTSLGGTAGVFTYNPHDLSTATIYIRCTDSQPPSAHEIRAGYHLFGIHGDGVSCISINNLRLTAYSCHGVSVKNGKNIVISDCSAEKIGGAVLCLSPSVIYGGNGYEFSNNSSICTISGSTAADIFDSGFSPQLFESNTALSSVTYDNCSAIRCGFAGIEISVLNAGGSINETIDGITVNDCTITGSGSGWSGIRYTTEGHGIRIKADSGSGSISGVSVSGTVISECRGTGIYIAGPSGMVKIHRSKISSNAGNGINCIEISGGPAPQLVLTSSIIDKHSSTYGVYYSVSSGSGFQIINDTFCGNSIALYIQSAGNTPFLKNNIFYSASQVYIYAAALGSDIDFDYNSYYEHGSNIIGINSTAYQAVSAYSAAVSKEYNSTGSDPQLVNTSADYHLQSSSPCKNSGTAVNVTDDYDGNILDPAHPSRGAYQ